MDSYLSAINEKAARYNVKAVLGHAYIIIVSCSLPVAFTREGLYENMFSDLSRFPEVAAEKKVRKRTRGDIFNCVYCWLAHQ